jgi:hypothetical protein
VDIKIIFYIFTESFLRNVQWRIRKTSVSRQVWQRRKTCQTVSSRKGDDPSEMRVKQPGGFEIRKGDGPLEMRVKQPGRLEIRKGDGPLEMRVKQPGRLEIRAMANYM